MTRPLTGARRREWSNPANLLTGLRVALVPVIAVLVGIGMPAARWWAFAVFVFAAASDSMDGWVARRYMGVSRWGQLADPLADKLLIGGTLVALAVLAELPWWAVVVILAREGAVTVWRQQLAGRNVVMPASIWGKTKTVVQVVAVALYLLPPAPAGLRVAVLVVAVAWTVGSGIEYVGRGQRLLRAR